MYFKLNSFITLQKRDDLDALRLSESERKQPFVICVGDPKLLEVSQAFVMVERRLLQTASVVGAVDLCFKVFHVLQVNFPSECFPVWSFFDHSVFKTNEIPSPPSSVLTISSQMKL